MSIVSKMCLISACLIKMEGRHFPHCELLEALLSPKVLEVGFVALSWGWAIEVGIPPWDWVVSLSLLSLLLWLSCCHSLPLQRSVGASQIHFPWVHASQCWTSLLSCWDGSVPNCCSAFQNQTVSTFRRLAWYLPLTSGPIVAAGNLRSCWISCDVTFRVATQILLVLPS